jgi:lipooligosaccharide transport system ATP-binding protein
MSFVIEVQNVRKSYGDRKAVDDISFEIKKNECFGLLGPNGAGKTSLLKMMYGSVEMSAGQMFILGMNVKSQIREIKSRIGVIPQEDGLDPDFTVLENLLVYASYHDLNKKEAHQRSIELLRWLRLEDYVHSHVEGLSGGLKRRLVIARSLLNNPEVIFLDEPTTGLDPQAREWIWDFFKELRKNQSTLVLTTHYMEEAEQMCDRVAIVDKGKILALDSPRNLILHKIGTDVVEFFCEHKDQPYYTSKLNQAGFEAKAFRQKVLVFVRQSNDIQKVLALIGVSEYSIRKASLNDVFMQLSGHDLVDAK